MSCGRLRGGEGYNGEGAKYGEGLMLPGVSGRSLASWAGLILLIATAVQYRAPLESVKRG